MSLQKLMTIETAENVNYSICPHFPENETGLEDVTDSDVR